MKETVLGADKPWLLREYESSFMLLYLARTTNNMKQLTEAFGWDWNNSSGLRKFSFTNHKLTDDSQVHAAENWALTHLQPAWQLDTVTYSNVQHNSTNKCSKPHEYMDDSSTTHKSFALIISIIYKKKKKNQDLKVFIAFKHALLLNQLTKTKVQPINFLIIQLVF